MNTTSLKKQCVCSTTLCERILVEEDGLQVGMIIGYSGSMDSVLSATKEL